MNRIHSATRPMLKRVAAAALSVIFMFGAVVTAQTVNGPSTNITLIADGRTWDQVTSARTVGQAVSEAGITLGRHDRLYPKPQTLVRDGIRIRITRVEITSVVETHQIGFKTVVDVVAAVSGGRMVLRQGETGEKRVRYSVITKDGVTIRKKVTGSHVTKKPVNEVVAVSKQRLLASRGWANIRHLRMVATGYDPHPRGGSGRTAIGMRAGRGVVAVDPRVIRLGSRLYVEGYGLCVAGDTGGAIHGNRIDLGFGTRREALRFGRRIVTVYVLN